MSKLVRPVGLATGLIAVCALIAFGAGAVGAKPKKKGKPDSGKVFVATTHAVGNTEYVAGQGTDKLFGTTAVTYVIKAVPSTPGTVKLTAKPVSTWGKAGTLTGKASATLNIVSATKATVTNGKLSETKGTGKWKGHTFVGTFTGSGNPTTMQYVFNYKGTFK